MLLDGSGNAYLYDASSDRYVIKQTVFPAPIQGYYGPVGASANGEYFLANGAVLNQAMTETGTAGTVSSGTATVPVPVSAVAPISAAMYARFVQPVRSGATATVTSPPTIQLVLAASGTPVLSVNALEGPLSTQAGTARVNVSGRTMAVDAAASNAFLLTTSGLSVIPLPALPTAPAGGGAGGPPGGGAGTPPGGGAGGPGGTIATLLANTPVVKSGGVVNMANFQTALAPDGIAAIMGTNLASQDQYASTPLPTMLGGVCVTLNNAPLPLLLTSSGQINAQIPPTLAAGKYPLVVRSIANNTESPSQTVTIAKYAPAVMVDPTTGLAAIYQKDGTQVTPGKPATRDQQLYMYATGLGPTTGGSVVTGAPAPSSPLAAVTGKVSVYFGPVGYSQAPVIVNWSGLAPGMIGVYQITVTVPGVHMTGKTLPVTVEVGGVSSPSTGINLPTVALN